MAWKAGVTLPTRKRIIEYWLSDEGRRRFEFTRWDESDSCFACSTTIRIERAHIVCRKLGGSDTVENFVLLCYDCHRDSPDSDDPADLFEWTVNGPTPEERFEARHKPEFDRLPPGMLDDLQRTAIFAPDAYKAAMAAVHGTLGFHGLEMSCATRALLLRRMHARLLAEGAIPHVIENHVVRRSSIRGTNPADPEWEGPARA